MCSKCQILTGFPVLKGILFFVWHIPNSRARGSPSDSRWRLNPTSAMSWWALVCNSLGLASDSMSLCYQLPGQSLTGNLRVFVYFVIGSNVTCFQDEVWRQGINYVIINEQTNSCLNKLSKALSFFLCVRQERKVILAGSLHSKHLLVSLNFPFFFFTF